MIRSLIKLGLMLLAGVLVYNYFFGTDTEKESSKKIFGQMRDLVVSASDIVRSERQKFDSGKYDEALEKLGGAYRAVRDRAQFVDDKILKRLDGLEDRKAELEKELNTIEKNEQQATSAPPAPKKGVKADPKAAEQTAAKAADQERRKRFLQQELEALLRDSDKLLQEASQE
jgi:hypothetical protein